MTPRNVGWAALGAAFMMVSTSTNAHASEPAPGKRSHGYLIGGTLLFAVPYVASNIVGLAYSVGRDVSCATEGHVDVAVVAGLSTATCPNRGYGWLTIPFAGPIISVAGYRQGTAAAVTLMSDSAAQLAGATLFIIGLIRKEDRPPARKAIWEVVPGAPAAPAGLALRIRGL